MAIFRQTLSGDSRLSINLTVSEINTTSGEKYDIQNNTSDVSYTLTLDKTGGYAYDLAKVNRCTITLNGQTVFNQLLSYDLQNVYSYTLASGVLRNIKHDDDGTKTISCSAYFDMTNNSKGTATASGTMVLATIPRTTTCPDLNGDIESSYNIPLSSAVDIFTHSLAVNFNGTYQYVNASGNLQTSEYIFPAKTQTILFTIPSSFYALFKGKSMETTMRLNTYNGNTLIGNSTGKLTLNCNAIKCSPYFEGTVQDINTTTKNLTGNANKIIKGYSTARVTLNSLRAAYSTKDTNSTITSRTIGGTSISGTTLDIPNAVSSTYVVIVENSRGFSTPLNLGSVDNLINYFTPQLNLEANRLSPTSNTITLKYSGSFFNSSFGSISNAITSFKWSYKLENASSWTDGGNITPTTSGNTITEKTVTLSGEFNYTSNYRFKIECADRLTTSSKEDDVLAGVPNHDWGKEHFEFHTNAYADKDLYVGFDDSYSGKLYVNGTEIKNTTIIDNLNSTSKTSALSANQGKILNEMIITGSKYSTQEQETNEVWIDGSKIYKKIFTGIIPTPMSGGWKTISNLDSDIIPIPPFTGTIQNPNSTETTAIPKFENTSYYASLRTYNKQLQILGDGYSGYTFTILLKYIKK